VSGFGACRTLFDVSLIHFVVRLLSQLKHILGLADQRAHASTFECVRLCSEGKIATFFLSFYAENTIVTVRFPDMDLVKDDLEFLYSCKEGAKNVENIDDITRPDTEEFYLLWSSGGEGGDTPRKIGWGMCGPFPKALTLFMTKICDFPYLIYDLTKNLIHYLWPLITAGTVALNTIYEGLLLVVLSMMMKK